MTPFNPDKKANPSYGDLLCPAMDITDQDDADQYFNKYVAFIRELRATEPDRDGKTAEQIAKTNLGEFASFYDNKVRRRIKKLFGVIAKERR